MAERFALVLHGGAGAQRGRDYRAEIAHMRGLIEAARDQTGHSRPQRAYAQVARDGPGPFLTVHDEEDRVKQRLYAYVLNMTAEWRPDWGGLLLFLDEDGHVAEGYTPAFNALNIFRVPARHAVSFVTPAAGAPRLSVTGWVRSRVPPEAERALATLRS